MTLEELEKLNKMKWQPIETAPKDGTKILAYDKCDGIGVVAFVGGYWEFVVAGGKVREVSHTLYDEGVCPVAITHWMPLPDPPEGV